MRYKGVCLRTRRAAIMVAPSPADARSNEMTRKLTLFALLAALSALLAACDKCGGFQEIRIPGQPHACKDGAPR